MIFYAYVDNERGQYEPIGGPFSTYEEGEQYLISNGMRGYVLSEEQIYQLTQQTTQTTPSYSRPQHKTAPVHFIGLRGAYRKNRR